MVILVEKADRRLTLRDDRGACLLTAPIALGSSPTGPKRRSGDGKTPEGRYFVCLKKRGKYGASLGVSYPNLSDAETAGAGPELCRCIAERTAQGMRPPWGTELGGEIYIHGGGTERAWTAGCIALRDEDAERLYTLTPLGTAILIEP